MKWDDVKNGVIGFLWALLICALIYMCHSCTTVKYVPVETVKETVRTEYSVRVDSIRDSIYVTERTKGDTVYLTKEVYKYKNLLLTDTVYVSKTDTVTKVVEVKSGGKEDTALTKWWKKFTLSWRWFGIGVIAAVVVVGLLHIIRKWKEKFFT